MRPFPRAPLARAGRRPAGPGPCVARPPPPPPAARRSGRRPRGSSSGVRHSGCPDGMGRAPPWRFAPVERRNRSRGAAAARRLRSAECSHSQPRSSGGRAAGGERVWARPPSRSRASRSRAERAAAAQLASRRRCPRRRPRPRRPEERLGRKGHGRQMEARRLPVQGRGRLPRFKARRAAVSRRLSRRARRS